MKTTEIKTISEQPKAIFDYLIYIHEKVSSWVAQIMGPTVFNYGTKEDGWSISTLELLQFPKGSLGLELGEFLQKNKLEPLARAEYHDVHHVLFDYTISFKDEVALQFFLHGNGQKSIASVSTLIGAWFILPTQWNYLKTAYKRGKTCKNLSSLNFKTLLYQDFQKLKASLFL